MPFQVALAGNHYHPVVAWLTCLRVFTITRGVSRYRVPVIASFSRCTQGKPQSGLKRCLADGPPPLPPGIYQAKLFQVTNLIRALPAVRVQVIQAAPGH